MMKKQKTVSSLEGAKVVADNLEDAEQWVDKNQNILWVALGVLILAGGGYFGFHRYLDKQEALAQQEMFQAVYYFESDSLRMALEGDGNNLGFDQIISDYSMTDAANLATYYAGFIRLKQGDFSEAIKYLGDFSSGDVLLQSRAYSLIGDAYMELKEYETAANYYHKASSHEPNKFFSPNYLLKEALAYEKLNQHDEAVALYQKIIDQYWDSDAFSTAQKLKARLLSNA